MTEPVIFAIRHLSAAAGFNVRKKLTKYKPDLVLIEGPANANDMLPWFCHKQTRLPIAILSYTTQKPLHTLLYPFAQYSAEYQAISWAYEHNIPCRFMDVPSDILLSLIQAKEQGLKQEQEDVYTKDTTNIYTSLEQTLEQSFDSIYERSLEQLEQDYDVKAYEFGQQIRLHSHDDKFDYALNHVREAYMKRSIVEAQQQGFNKIFCVCGAYHAPALKQNEPLSDSEFEQLNKFSISTNITLMPYSYYRLSKQSGYGAGNNAPAYFDFVWQALKSGDYAKASYLYLSHLCQSQRQQGYFVSTAHFIDAIKLANTLAYLRNSKYPTLEDLKDAAITCIAQGNAAALSVAFASVDIGKKIGKLPTNVSRTALQDDFYKQLKNLKLEKYCTFENITLDLDLRENLKVKSQDSAFLDLNRSFFFNRLRVLNIDFARQTKYKSDAIWGESWNLRWSEESEIQIVESALLGETIKLAATFALKEQANNCTDIASASAVFEEAFLCGLTQVCEYALKALQKLSVNTAAIEEISKCMYKLANTIKYGSLRKFNQNDTLTALLEQFYLRACLILAQACICDDKAANDVIESIERINKVQIDLNFLDQQRWVDLLKDISNRDDLNTKCSGFAMAILIERGLVDENLLNMELSRRLAKGVAADLGAAYFEGLAQKNRYSLILRLSLWKILDNYLQSLDDEEFKRALVFLRRTFSEFKASEKSDIAENLGQIWGLNQQQVSKVLMSDENLTSIDDFNFDDI